jgi:hypothetical protein
MQLFNRAAALCTDKQLDSNNLQTFARILFKATVLGVWQGPVGNLIDSPKNKQLIDNAQHALGRLEEMKLIKRLPINGSGVILLVEGYEIMGKDLHKFVVGTTPTNLGTTPTNLGTTPTNLGTTPTNLGTTPTNLGGDTYEQTTTYEPMQMARYALSVLESSISEGLVYNLSYELTYENPPKGASRPNAPKTVVVPYPIDPRSVRAGQNYFAGSQESSNSDSIKSLRFLSLENSKSRNLKNLKTEDNNKSQNQNPDDPAAEIIRIIFQLTTGDPEDSQFPVDRLMELWTPEAEDLLNKCDNFEHVSNVVTWAITQDNFWAKCISTAKNPMNSVNKNFEKMELGYFTFLKKNQKPKSRPQNPKNHTNPSIDEDEAPRITSGFSRIAKL